jgi:hypothetical protein
MMFLLKFGLALQDVNISGRNLDLRELVLELVSKLRNFECYWRIFNLKTCLQYFAVLV